MINLVVMGISAQQKGQDESSFTFLFPTKSPVEIMVCSIVTFAQGYLLTLMDLNIIVLIVAGLSSYSLYSGRCPESAVYRDNDDEFAFGSNHYKRPIYNIALAAVSLYVI